MAAGAVGLGYGATQLLSGSTPAMAGDTNHGFAEAAATNPRGASSAADDALAGGRGETPADAADGQPAPDGGTTANGNPSSEEAVGTAPSGGDTAAAGQPGQAAGSGAAQASETGPGGEPVPQDHPKLDAWLLKNDPKDPHLVITIASSPTAEAVVHLYDGDKLVGSMYGYGGPPDDPTIEGSYKLKPLWTIHTGLYKKTLGHEFWLRDFIQIKGNYGLHAYKINDATDAVEPGPTHGCVALPPGDEKALFHWVGDDTTAKINYVGADAALWQDDPNNAAAAAGGAPAQARLDGAGAGA